MILSRELHDFQGSYLAILWVCSLLLEYGFHSKMVFDYYFISSSLLTLPSVASEN